MRVFSSRFLSRRDLGLREAKGVKGTPGVLVCTCGGREGVMGLCVCGGMGVFVWVVYVGVFVWVF